MSRLATESATAVNQSDFHPLPTTIMQNYNLAVPASLKLKLLPITTLSLFKTQSRPSFLPAVLSAIVMDDTTSYGMSSIVECLCLGQRAVDWSAHPRARIISLTWTSCTNGGKFIPRAMMTCMCGMSVVV